MPNRYETLFAPVSFQWREDAAIAADLAAPGDSAASKRAAAKIEQVIKQGDAEFRRRRYQAALCLYKEARALIYQLITPQFDVSVYVRSMDYVALPADVGLESKINLAGIRLVDAVRPTETSRDVVSLPSDRTEVVPGRLQPVIRLGFRERTGRDALVRDTSVFGGATLRPREWVVGVPAGETPVDFEVGNGRIPTTNELDQKIYIPRVNRADFKHLAVTVVDTSTVSFYLKHLYWYILPLKMGDAFHELGQYENAETNYLIAANYSSLNVEIEATVVWLRLARNALEWGIGLYKAEEIAEAKAQFEKIIGVGPQIPSSFLYSIARLGVPGNEASTLIGQIAQRPLPQINPEIAALILRAWELLVQLEAGLDFYGLVLSPIHTFEYLQQVSRAFCQQSIQAEREFINFKSRQELESATRRELEAAVHMANAEIEGRREMLEAAQADATAAQRAVTLAQTRRNDAIAQRNQYASSSATQIWAAAASQALLGGSDAFYGEISELADRLDRGETIRGERGKLAAAQTLLGGRKTRDYELARMQDTINQLGQAINVAQAQLTAANARAAAAEIALQAAEFQGQVAEQSLEAFDGEFFTPDAWARMAGIMRWISRGYLWRAIRVAKLMERSYNFENDETLQVIKMEYGFGIANDAPGRDTRLLGGDALLADVDSFTYHAITNTTRKTTRIKDVVSLRADYPAQFEQFLETGLLQFETDLFDFERMHPGFYEQRIEAVEVEVIGLLADAPLRGTLTAGGVTSFRRRDDSLGSRTHVVDTMALSDFTLRNDMFLYTADTGVRGLFQGLGLGGTWQLHLPRRSNDLDLRRIFDIRLALYYKAKYDRTLRDTVLARPLRPDELAAQKSWSLRFDFPGAWYAFYGTGTVTVPVGRERFPANQENFLTSHTRFRVRTQNGVAEDGIDLRLMAPGGAAIDVTTAGGGIVSTDDAALAALRNIDPIGDWEIQVLGGAPLDDGAGGIDRDRVYDVQMSLDYRFDYLPEVF